MARLGPRAVLLALLAPLLVPTALAAVPASSGAATPIAVVASAPADQVDVDVPDVDWKRCQGYPKNTQCASVDLPLDYDDPDGPTTPIGLLRVRATDQADRVGSLFVNPGGPGGSATGFAASAENYFSKDVLAHFDVVGIDPRGVATSGFASCRADESTFEDYPRAGYPITDAQERATIKGDADFTRACRQNRSAIVDHMSTADVARDMDVVRQALGDDQITYYGVSYGTMIGQTYAAMFPDRIRALVIDGVLDPIAWTSGRGEADTPVTYRLRSGEGAYEELASALVECDRVGPQRCAAAGDAYGKWQHVYRGAAAGKLRLDGRKVTPQDVVGQALGTLYDAGGIPYLMRFIKQADQALDGDRPATLDATWAELVQRRRAVDRVGPYAVPGLTPAATGDQKYQTDVAFQSVLCSDSVNPTDPAAWVDASRKADRKQPWFGRLWTWNSSFCSRWPSAGGQDAYRGPWATETSHPLLVIGNFHDPATPISGARAANRLFDDSVLLTADVYGHGAIGTGACVDRALTRYLVNQTTPVDGRVCKPDRPLFP